jgi:CRP-like cAMP-binding protein
MDVLRKHIEKIVALTDKEFAYISSHFTSKRFKRKEFIFQQGNDVTSFYFVVSGLLMLTHHEDSGKQHVVSFAMEDWWETDLHAFFNKDKATMSLQCLEDTEVLCVTIDDFNELCANQPKVEHLFFKKSIRGHVASQQRILSFITSNAKERYDRLLAQHPALLQRVPKTLLASYLGVSRETLSRLSS